VVEAKPKHGLSTEQANHQLNSYFKAEQKSAAKPQVAKKPVVNPVDKKVAEKKPKFGLTTAGANKDFERYFQTQAKKAKVANKKGSKAGVAKQARIQSLFMPWYEVASEGDGMGPESVSVFRVPPKMALAKADEEKEEMQAPPNTFQKTTVWNADHVLNGGNKEWAEEDGALHAYNMQRWRGRILDEQIERQKKQWDLMNAHNYCDYHCSGGRCWCGHSNHGRHHWKEGEQAVLAGDKDGEQSQAEGDSMSLKTRDEVKQELEKNLRMLEENAAKGLRLLEDKGSMAQEKQDTLDMEKILDQIKDESNLDGPPKDA